MLQPIQGLSTSDHFTVTLNQSSRSIFIYKTDYSIVNISLFQWTYGIILYYNSMYNSITILLQFVFIVQTFRKYYIGIMHNIVSTQYQFFMNNLFTHW